MPEAPDPNSPGSSAPKPLKSTLNLPQTAFPMKANLPVNEPLRLAQWEESDLYGQIRRARAGSPRYLLHDGPPYANGAIHLGHALNKGLKDFIVKSKTMAGFDAPYVPGCDCHGLPIEIKVEEQLGRKRLELPATAIMQACRAYAQKFVDLQISQFVRLGIFGRWDKPYKTMDPRLRGPHPGSLLWLSRKGLRLPRPQARLLVHPRPHHAGRGRSRVREPHLALHLRPLQTQHRFNRKQRHRSLSNSTTR